MPKIVGPVEAQTTAAAHALKAKHAAEAIGEILAGRDTLSDDQRRDTLRDASKAIEAAGCYIRRKHEQSLLIP